jgi:polar amino acid transport system substrate-binding protein
MSGKNVLLVILAAALAGGMSYLAARHAGGAVTTAAHETTLERVERTGVIRCGYIVWPPYLTKDPNTGALTGPARDYMEALAQELGLKLEWTEETGWGNYFEGLNTGRYDLVCTPVWESGPRARAATLSKPLFYDPMFAIVRADDNRFDSNLKSIDNANARIAVIEGDSVQTVRRTQFPSAQEITLSPNADSAQLMLNVATRKADVALDTYDIFSGYNAHAGTGEKLKLAGGGAPVELWANMLAAKQGEASFMAAINAAVDVINGDGRGPAILEKFGMKFRPVAPGYATAQ